jgi:hypothetical protein
MKEDALKQERKELDNQWDCIMKDAGQGNINQFMIGILMDQYNRIDEELVKMTYKVDGE